MILIPLVLAPVLMFAAIAAEKRFGAAAGGWVAALPVALPLGVLAVAADSGSTVATALVSSAGAHVVPQVIFAATFAVVLRESGILAGFAVGAAAYAAMSVLLAGLPDLFAAAGGVPVLILARLYVRPDTRRDAPSDQPSERGSSTILPTALACLGSGLVVGVAVVGSRLAGPEIGGALSAFPTVSSLLVLSLVRGRGNGAGADSLAGLVRSLPCYLVFCVCTAATMPIVGISAIPLALTACLLVGRMTWTSVTVRAPSPAMA
jgi:hypothetical protein